MHCLLWSNRFLQYYSHTQTHTHTHIYIYIRSFNFNLADWKDASDSKGPDGIYFATLPCLVMFRCCFADILHFLVSPMLMFWGRQCLGSVHCLLWSNRFLQYYSHTQTHTHICIYIYKELQLQSCRLERRVGFQRTRWYLLCNVAMPCHVQVLLCGYPAFFGETDAAVLGQAVQPFFSHVF